MFCFWLLSRVVLWSVLVGVLMVVYQRGLERCVGDVVGFGRELSVVWWREYERWEGFADANGSGGGRGGSSLSGGSGRGRVYRSGYR